MTYSDHEYLPPTYKNHRFPPKIISDVVWLYCGFCPDYRDVEELLFARQYPWRAVDQDRSVLDILVQLVQPQRDKKGTHQRERRMQGFKSPAHAQRFLSAYGLIAQHFRQRRTSSAPLNAVER